MKPTYAEIANNWSLWQEYVDPNGDGGKDEFEGLIFEERIKLQVEIWGPEEASEEEDA